MYVTLWLYLPINLRVFNYHLWIMLDVKTCKETDQGSDEIKTINQK